MKRICIVCGAVYDGTPSSIKCPACAEQAKRDVMRERVCRECGATFIGGPRAWYCPPCRAERKRKKDAEYKRLATKGHVRRLGSIDVCPVCGKEYTVTGGNQRYCPTCAPEVIREKDREAARAWARANTDNDARRELRQQATAPINCVICGKSFVPDSTAITCSPECSALLAKKMSATHEAKYAELRKKRRNEQRKAHEAAMSESEYAEYRAKINAAARAAHARRKANKKEHADACPQTVISRS